MSKIADLKEKQAKLIKQARETWDRQYQEDRDLSKDERSQYEKIMGDIDKLKGRIKEEERLQELEESLGKPVEDAATLGKEEVNNKSGKTNNKGKTSSKDWLMGIENQGSDKEEVITEEPDSNKGNGRGGVTLLSRLNKQKQEMAMSEDTTTKTNNKTKKKSPTSSGEDNFRELKNKLHRALIDEIDNESFKEAGANNNEELEQEVRETVERLLDEEEQSISSTDRDKILSEILNETLGYGPITPLIEDEKVSEVMVNGPNQVYVEEEGKLKLTDVSFRDEQHVLHVIEKIVAPLGRRIDESSPMVDARLPDGSRVNAIVPPLSLVGPVMTIRKFSEDPLKAKDLVSFGTMTTEIADFLNTCVDNRLNIVVSGGTGSGKTTTLNVLSSFIPKTERIVTIEDAAELTLHQDHVVTLETRPPNMEGKGAITMRDLVANSLRMRPDRIVVGEVRGGEALDMLQAMNTGHDGSLTTGHANSPRDMLSRLETMVLMAGMDLPIRAIREQIASAIDLIVQQTRLEDGSRKIVKVSEVQGLEGDVITMQDLYTFKREGRDSQNKIKGKFESTGFTSVFLDKIKK